jgi:hypothetical protein
VSTLPCSIYARVKFSLVGELTRQCFCLGSHFHHRCTALPRVKKPKKVDKSLIKREEAELLVNENSRSNE